MRSFKLVIVSLACLTLIAGGCGKKNPPAEPQPPPVVQEPTPPPVAPPPAPPAEPEPEPLNLANVYFDYDRYDLKEDARATLAANAKQLEGNTSARITIEGHCDERGTTEYNLALGEKRAQAARDYLVNYGIAGDRLSTVSYGEERPVDPGSNEDAWAKNRRAAFVLR
jgi:peptidoglycan-associated lipoprotein